MFRWIPWFTLLIVAGMEVPSIVWGQSALERLEGRLDGKPATAPGASGGAGAAGGGIYFGVVLDGREAVGSGLRVVSVEAKSPADKAGIRRGDLITAVDGQRVRNLPQFSRAIMAKQPGQAVMIDYLREGVEASARVTLAKLAAKAPAGAVPRDVDPAGVPDDPQPITDEPPAPDQPPEPSDHQPVLDELPEPRARGLEDRVVELERAVARLEKRLARIEALLRRNVPDDPPESISP